LQPDGGRENTVLTIRAIIDQETYERIVHEAVEVDSPIPHHAGAVLRRAFGLPTREAPRHQVIDLVAIATNPKDAA
jgi:hypothetical protein